MTERPRTRRTGFHVHGSVTTGCTTSRYANANQAADSYQRFALKAATADRNCIASDTNNSARNGWTCGIKAHFICSNRSHDIGMLSRPTAAIAISDHSLPRTRRKAPTAIVNTTKKFTTRATGHSETNTYEV